MGTWRLFYGLEASKSLVRLSSVVLISAIFLLAGCPDEPDPTGTPSPSPTAALPSLPALVLPEGDLQFGQVVVGEEVSRTLLVQNAGQAELRITPSLSRSADGQLTLPGGEAERAVGPGASLDLEVRYRPTQAGSLAGALKLLSNDEDHPETEVTIVGEAVMPDQDGDGSLADEDCDDTQASVYPGADEGCDGLDNDCDQAIDEGTTQTVYPDGDGDGYGVTELAEEVCAPGAGEVLEAGDCDDGNEAISPAATEVCDLVDNDCDGQVDVGAADASGYFTDADQDGYGANGIPVEACQAPEGMVDQAGDCLDSDPRYHPGALEEDCADPADYNCDGSSGFADGDGDGYAACIECNDQAPEIHPGAQEVCDGVDNDCSGLSDDGLPVQDYFRDADQDGYGASEAVVSGCQAPDGFVAAGGDCQDSNPQINPAASEACNGWDDDCDGQVDEDQILSTWYPDQDGDGHGEGISSQEACQAPDGYVGVGDDCQDQDAQVFPGAPEACDGLDNDCDAEVDEGLSQVAYFADEDGDGYGDGGVPVSSCGSLPGLSANGEDCLDSDAGVNPGAVERCDGLDNDCDGAVDEEAVDALEWYVDQDEDGYGAGEVVLVACSAQAGLADQAGDCNDSDTAYHPGASEASCADPHDYNCDGSTAYADADQDGYAACEECNDGDGSVYPGAEERCDSLDNNCDGQADEGVQSTYYHDGDADGFGAAASPWQGCPPPPAGYVEAGGDCADANPQIFPGASEVCNGKDDDCDAATDELGAVGCTQGWLDADGDGYGGTPVCACVLGGSYVSKGGDCDDGNGKANPSATEQCNGFDDDCDGQTDEAKATGCDKYYLDGDGDGYGSSSSQCLCQPEDDYSALVSGDCVDTDAAMYPYNTEICDGKDNNCSGQVDEGVKSVYYIDSDGDGYGATYNSKEACTTPTGYVALGGDCNDYNNETYPTAPEQCNELDDDCDGRQDEGLTTQTIYKDNDGDGFAAKSASSQQKCDVPVGWTTVKDYNKDGVSDWDCDDTNVTAFPGADEACDGADNNCDGFVDTQCPTECSGVWPVPLSVPSHMPARLLDYNGDSLEELYIIDSAGKLRQISPQGAVTTVCSGLTFYTGYGNKFGWTVNPELGAWKFYFVQGTRLYDLDSCVEVKASAGDVSAFGSVGDFDGDRKLDYAGHFEVNANVCFKLSSKGYTTQCLPSPNGKVYDGYFTTADVDGDGKSEAITMRGRTYPDASYYDGNVDVYGYNGVAMVLENSVPPSATGFIGSHISGLDVTDYYDDGYDLTTALFGGKVLDLASRTVVDTYVGDGVPNPATFDLNGDGELEGVRQGVLADMDADYIPESIFSSGNLVSVVRNQSGYPAMDGWPISVGTITWSVTPVAGDVDNDGRLDVYVPSVDGVLYCFRLGKGSAAFTNIQDRGEPEWLNRTMAKDPYEPNNSMAAAWPLSFPTKELRGRLTLGDVDYYRLPSTGGLYIQLHSPPGQDYDFVWTNHDGSRTYYTSSQPAGKVDSVAICVGCTETVPSSYVVKVQPKNATLHYSGSEAYVLKISKIP